MKTNFDQQLKHLFSSRSFLFNLIMLLLCKPTQYKSSHCQKEEGGGETTLTYMFT